MITQATKHWIEAIQRPIPKRRKNQTIGNRQILCRQALQAELKQPAKPSLWAKIFKVK